MIGTVLVTRYRLVKLLGAGGFGAVYLADDNRIQGRRVAVKESFDTSPGARRQFEREAQLLARLDHPQLVDVNDYFALPSEELFLVMDYVEGESLREMLDRSGPLPENQAVEYVKQVCEALEYMHTWVDPTTGQRAPIIHRDIKPDNLKWTPQGRVVVIDLGIAKVYDPKRPTTVGAKGVAPGFSPLEQYGKGLTDARSDVYALGATLYCLLTGEIPPEATDRVVNQTPVPPPRQFNPAVSLQTARVIEKAMQLQARDRYQSAKEMRQKLERVLTPIPNADPEDLVTNLPQLLKKELSPASIKGGMTQAKLRITNRGQGHFSGEITVSKFAPWFSVPNPWIDCPPGQTVTVDIHIAPQKYSAWRDFSFRPITIKQR
ncbi:MAG: serine/threonine protein kinase [Anaerolineae bacterium]